MSYSTFTVTRTFLIYKAHTKVLHQNLASFREYLSVWPEILQENPWNSSESTLLRSYCRLTLTKKNFISMHHSKTYRQERWLVKKYKILVNIRPKPTKFYRKNSTQLYNWHVKYENMLICTFSKFELDQWIFVSFHQKFSYLQTIMKKFHHFTNFKVKSLKFWL